MRPRPKLRTFCRWMLTILTVVLVVVWFGSGFFEIVYRVYTPPPQFHAHLSVGFARGLFFFGFSVEKFDWVNFTCDAWQPDTNTTYQLTLWYWRSHIGGYWREVEFPLWFASLLFAIPTALMWRTRFIALGRKSEICVNCRYDISGLVDKDTCPECGTKFPAQISKASV